MTIEEIEKEWLEWSKSDAAKYSGHLKMPSEIWKAAKQAYMLETHITSLQHALEDFEIDDVPFGSPNGA